MKNTMLCVALYMGITAGEKKMHAAEMPGWAVFPDKKWEMILPQETGLDSAKWNAWLAEQKPVGAETDHGGAEQCQGHVECLSSCIINTDGKSVATASEDHRHQPLKSENESGRIFLDTVGTAQDNT